MSYVVDRPLESSVVINHPSMSFRAIFAGWLVATGIAALLYIGGLALGFSAFNAWDPEAATNTIGIGTAIWLILTWITSLLLGGLFASWFDARDDQTMGVLHGVTVWGLSVTTTGLWLMLGLANAMHPHPGDMSGMRDAHGGSAGTTALHGDGSVAILQADISARVNSHDRGATDAIVAALIAGKADVASNLLAANMSTTPNTAAETLNQLQPQISAAQGDAKATAERAAHYSAMMLWIVFLSIFLALLASAMGGWLGAGHIHRVYHLRNYPGRLVR